MTGRCPCNAIGLQIYLPLTDAASLASMREKVLQFRLQQCNVNRHGSGSHSLHSQCDRQSPREVSQIPDDKEGGLTQSQEGHAQ